MSRKKNIFEKFPQKWPKGVFARRVGGERGNIDLPSGAKGGEKMDLEHLIKDDRLADALTTLPQRFRDILLMYWFLELADREIGEKLNLSRRTVNNRRLRAYAMLKELMGGEANE